MPKGEKMRLIILILVAVFQQACAYSSPVTRSSSYQPGDHEQFVIVEKHPKLQKFGIRSFCKEPTGGPYCKKISYNRYVGMKGYFKDIEPVSSRLQLYWPVILENGQEFFYVTSKNSLSPDKYKRGEDIVPLEQYERMMGFSSEPLVPGSNIQVESAEISFGRDFFTLSNGSQIDREKLSYIRDISARFPSQSAQIAESLLAFNISYDIVDDKYFIKPISNIKISEVGLYIGISSNKTWLRMNVKYKGENWLFVRSYIISADSLRWQSPTFEFKRDHSGGWVWEWIDVAPTQQDLQNMGTLAQAKTPMVRFRGDKYYSDLKLSNQQQESISNILSLYEMLKQ